MSGLQEKLAAASFAWLGGKERGYHYSSRKMVKVGWESNFGELLGKVDH